MRYILIIVIILSITGCTRPKVVKVPRPTYPIMKSVIIEKDGSLTPSNTQNVIHNMLGMSKLIDELFVAPCYDQSK